jgi:segregation and condensation protein B
MTDEAREALNEENVELIDEEPEPVPEDVPAHEDEPAFEQSDAQMEESQATDEERELAQESEAPADAFEVTEETGEPEEEGEAVAQMEEPTTQGHQQQEPVIQEQGQAPTVESVIEAILFATDEPLPESRLASIVETTIKQVRASIESLNAKYEANNSAFRIEQIAGGYQMLTLSTYNHWLKKMVHVRSETKLSPAAMETLAIIAYKQPVIRADIEAIRGVAVGEVIRSLMYKGLVKIVGRAEILGRPMLYGTTKKFLEVFGLNSLKDLPKAEDLKNPDRQ